MIGEQGALTADDWADLLAGEDEPFGATGAGLAWRPKDRHVTFRDGGRLIAAAGALVAGVRVGSEEGFDVVGIGSVIVTHSLRGRGLMRKLMDELLRVARTLGPARAMLFCRPQLVSLYGRFGFREIGAPVSVDQPDGRLEMPLSAMWRPLVEGVQWPRGRVEVDGLPF
jgi:GNAT superfamily N-acetyltransferase